ncbi:PTS sugar transporter subunit IIC [Clostridium sp. SYSU_GA19001]|uniref:PTS sugar transporter subunit IIC n=1 Tax=Clostridium caldaquaticum TaxID=2940653 RepID=UPI0020777236|nr:PTS sugar transporter subunit IIC [Clostridium caldaquaticum]MCM8710005.1 PTS sugar transporter subunit IIC [Clostridium caldaquaticum]
MSDQQKLMDKVVPAVMKFVNTKAVIALKDGIMYTMPLSLVGSIFLLLAQIPYKPFNDWVASIFGPNWINPLLKIYNGSFALMALAAVMGIAYTYTKNEGHEGLPAAIIALCSLVILIPGTVTAIGADKKEIIVGGVLPSDWLGGKGMVLSIIVGLLVGYVYSLFLTKKITIKMPEEVPAGVAKQFTALIPALAIFTGLMLVNILFSTVFNSTFAEWIFKTLQTPLQGVTDSLIGVFIMGAVIPFFWWFGVHGANIVGGVMSPIYTANQLANQAILDSGKALTLDNGAHIITEQFQSLFVTVTGSGLTIGLVIAMLLAAKSAQSKTLGKLAVWPAIFNINEPVTFGFPIVMNPFMFIPFVFVPLVSAVATYFAFKIGFLHPFSAVTVPWTTPPIISGFILQGWKGALWQIVIIAWSTVAYFPFFKKQDAINLKAEQESMS